MFGKLRLSVALVLVLSSVGGLESGMAADKSAQTGSLEVTQDVSTPDYSPFAALLGANSVNEVGFAISHAPVDHRQAKRGEVVSLITANPVPLVMLTSSPAASSLGVNEAALLQRIGLETPLTKTNIEALPLGTPLELRSYSLGIEPKYNSPIKAR